MRVDSHLGVFEDAVLIQRCRVDFVVFVVLETGSVALNATDGAELLVKPLLEHEFASLHQLLVLVLLQIGQVLDVRTGRVAPLLTHLVALQRLLHFHRLRVLVTVAWLHHLQTIRTVSWLIGLCLYLAVRVQLLPIKASEHFGLGRQAITLRPVVLEVPSHQVDLSALSGARVQSEVLGNDAGPAGFLEVLEFLVRVDHLHTTLHVHFLCGHVLPLARCFAHPLVCNVHL